MENKSRADRERKKGQRTAKKKKAIPEREGRGPVNLVVVQRRAGGLCLGASNRTERQMLQAR